MAALSIRRRGQAGFTLIELMAVVVITGVLALAGVSVFRKYIFAAKGGEALSVIQAIRSAEEAYQAENHVYLNVSTGTNWFPRLVPNQNRVAWGDPDGLHPDGANWAALAPSIKRTVLFSYLVNAGIAGVAIPKPEGMADPGFALPTQNWYLIQATGDTDGDGVFANYASSSMTGEIYGEREGE
ncbi:MAG: prepilin-type N-terminal cleavage/methylation domain-containing protein [Pseudomonadota bacterium]